MAGHSHWAQIKRKKAVQDAKRGKLFTKLIREIIIAVRAGGSGDPELNPRLRAAIQAARAANMPKENIERAIKKALGLEEGTNYEEAVFEGYGPGGVAILINAITDNRRRTVSELRHIFSKHGGNLAEPGAEDTKEYESEIEIVTDPSQFEDVKKALEEAKIEIISAKITMVPKTTVPVEDEATASSLLKLIEALDDHDDVQQVYANFDIPEKIMEALNK